MKCFATSETKRIPEQGEEADGAGDDGGTISHTAAWSVTQAIGEQLDIKERRAAELASKHEGAGGIEVALQ